MDYTNDKVIIISEDEFNSYPKEFGKNHQCYLDEYAKEKNYKYSSIRYLAEMGNCVFLIIGPVDGKYFIGGYMPEVLTDIQLYYLEYIRNTFSSISLLDIKRLQNNVERYYSVGLDGTNCEKYFYDVILQSYYGPKDEKLKGK